LSAYEHLLAWPVVARSPGCGHMTPVPLDVINPQPSERTSSALRAAPDRPDLHAAADEFSGRQWPRRSAAPVLAIAPRFRKASMSRSDA